MSIQQFSQGTPTSASQVPFYDPDNGVDRRCSLSELIAAAGLSASADGRATQYAAPAASGYTVAVTPPEDGQSVWLLILAAGAYAAGTVTLPAVASCADRQEVEILSTQNLTTLTVAGNGATVNTPLTALTAGVPKKLRFDAVTSTWYPAL